jgi:hypothetical protein
LRPVGGNLSPMVRSAVFERRDASYRLLSLVNVSGHFGTSYFAPIPMTGKECRMVAGQGEVTVKAPRLELFECVKILFTP